MNMNQRIRHYIENNGLKFRYVAKASGIDEKKFSRMMNNNQKIVTDEYEMICKALNVEPTYFFKSKFLETKNKSAWKEWIAIKQKIEPITLDVIEKHFTVPALKTPTLTEENQITNPYEFKLFAECQLWQTIKDKEKYCEQLKSYNKLFDRHFKKHVEEIQDHLLKYFPSFSVFGVLDFTIKNHYDHMFSNYGDRISFRSEKDLQSILYDFFYWSRLNETFKVRKEKSSTYGRIDLFIESVNDNFDSIIELKTGTAKRKDVYQVHDYRQGLKNTESVLIANEIDHSVLELAKTLDVFCVEYKIHEELPDTVMTLDELNPGSEFMKL